MRLVLLAFVIVVCSACTVQNTQLYDGPPLPIESVATLSSVSGSHPSSNVFVAVKSVDGKVVPSAASFYLLPGQHSIQASIVVEDRASGPQKRKVGKAEGVLDAQAGHTYLPAAVLRGDNYAVFGFEDMGVAYPQECLPMYRTINESNNPGHAIWKDGRKCDR